MPEPSSSHTSAPLLCMRGIGKRFPGVVALADVSLHLRAGEVLALAGENGAGKSTLMKILGGALAPDEGVMELDGRPLRLAHVAEGKRAGIVLIPQELMPVGNLSVAGNIFLGQEPGRGWLLSRLDRRALNAGAAQLLDRVGLRLPPTTPMSRLTTGQAQLVEVARALAQNARVLVMDEPTSSLALGEVEHLFRLIRGLKQQGVGIISITHRLSEITELADRITVLRDGRNVGDLDPATAPHHAIVSLMVGRPLTSWFPPPRDQPPGEPVLEVSDLLVPGASQGVSFALRRGEILGFAGLVGAGRTELLRVIFGVDLARGGQMRLAGLPYSPRKPRDAIRRGVYLVPEDRKRHGLVLPFSIARNISLPSLEERHRWYLSRRGERRAAQEAASALAIKAPSVGARVVNLSGGNQQKVVLGKWLAMRPQVLLLDEPTRGIDVGARAEIYRDITALADRGIAIALAGSDLEEVLGLCDRVAVMHNRRLAGVLTRAEATPDRIARMMMGGVPTP